MSEIAMEGTSVFLGEVTPAGVIEAFAKIRKHHAVDPTDPRKWLNDVYSLLKRDPDQAVDLLFEHVDDHLLAGDFARCDALLNLVDLKRLDTNLIVSLLRITAAAADRLPYRATLLARARKVLAELAPGRSERLLQGM